MPMERIIRNCPFHELIGDLNLAKDREHAQHHLGSLRQFNSAS